MAFKGLKLKNMLVGRDYEVTVESGDGVINYKGWDGKYQGGSGHTVTLEGTGAQQVSYNLLPAVTANIEDLILFWRAFPQDMVAPNDLFGVDSTWTTSSYAGYNGKKQQAGTGCAQYDWTGTGSAYNRLTNTNFDIAKLNQGRIGYWWRCDDEAASGLGAGFRLYFSNIDYIQGRMGLDKFNLYWRDGVLTEDATGLGLSLDTWYFVEFSYDTINDLHELYIDGEVVHTFAMSPAVSTCTTSSYIDMGFITSENSFDYYIDNVMIASNPQCNLHYWRNFTNAPQEGVYPPINTAKPVVTGDPLYENVLTCTSGGWSQSGTITYQWQRDYVDIAGATNPAYTITLEDNRELLRCIVTNTNSDGYTTEQIYASRLGYVPTEHPDSLMLFWKAEAMVMTEPNEVYGSDPSWTVGAQAGFNTIHQKVGPGCMRYDYGGTSSAYNRIYNTKQDIAKPNQGRIGYWWRCEDQATSGLGPGFRLYFSADNYIWAKMGLDKFNLTWRDGVNTFTKDLTELGLSLGEWYFVEFSYDTINDTHQLYIDEQVVHTFDMSPAVTDILSSLYIEMGSLTSENSFDYYIDNLMITDNPNTDLSVWKDYTNAPKEGIYPPINTAKPVLTGDPLYENVMSCTQGTWSGAGNTYTYQWQRDYVDIAGATNNTHTVTLDDNRELLRCIVTATNSDGYTTEQIYASRLSYVPDEHPDSLTLFWKADSLTMTEPNEVYGSDSSWQQVSDSNLDYQYQKNGNGCLEISDASSGSGYMMLNIINFDVAKPNQGRVGAWWRCDDPSLSTLGPGFRLYFNADNYIQTRMGLDKFQLYWRDGALTEDVTGLGLTLEDWYFVEFSYDTINDIHKLYIDGQLIHTFAMSPAVSTVPVTSAIMYVGSLITESGGFKYYMDNIMSTDHPNTDLSVWKDYTNAPKEGIYPPINTVKPVVSGDPLYENVMSCTAGTWSPAGTSTYQWQRDYVDISGATNSTYTVTAEDDNRQLLSCIVTATNSDGYAKERLFASKLSYIPDQHPDNIMMFWTAESITMGSDDKYGIDPTWQMIGDSQIEDAHPVRIEDNVFMLQDTNSGSGYARLSPVANDVSNIEKGRMGAWWYCHLPATSAVSGCLFESYVDVANSMKVRMNTTQCYLSIEGNNVVTTETHALSSPLDQDKWYFVEFAWDRRDDLDLFELYVDGTKVHTFTTSFTPYTNFTTTNLYMGILGLTGSLYEYRMDNMMIADNPNTELSTWKNALSYPVEGVYPPLNTVVPVITGTMVQGNQLSCTQGTWSPVGVSYTYQWLREGEDIASATNSTYTLTADDGRFEIECRVTATNTDGIGEIRASAGIASLNDTDAENIMLFYRGEGLTMSSPSDKYGADLTWQRVGGGADDSTTVKVGTKSQAFYTNSTSGYGYIRLNSYDVVDPNQGRVGAWWYTDDPGVSTTLGCFSRMGIDATNYIHTEMQLDFFRLIVEGDDVNTVEHADISGLSLQQSTWYFVEFEWDNINDSYKLYVDDTLAHTFTTSFPVFTSQTLVPGFFHFGVTSSIAGGPWRYNMDNMMITDNPNHSLYTWRNNTVAP